MHLAQKLPLPLVERIERFFRYLAVAIVAASTVLFSLSGFYISFKLRDVLLFKRIARLPINEPSTTTRADIISLSSRPKIVAAIDALFRVPSPPSALIASDVSQIIGFLETKSHAPFKGAILQSETFKSALSGEEIQNLDEWLNDWGDEETAIGKLTHDSQELLDSPELTNEYSLIRKQLLFHLGLPAEDTSVRSIDSDLFYKSGVLAYLPVTSSIPDGIADVAALEKSLVEPTSSSHDELTKLLDSLRAGSVILAKKIEATLERRERIEQKLTVEMSKRESNVEKIKVKVFEKVLVIFRPHAPTFLNYFLPSTKNIS